MEEDNLNSNKMKSSYTMKYLQKFKIFENSSFPTDRGEIRRICEEYKIRKYNINQDGSVDVNGTVNLSRKGLTRLPLKFGRVSGRFYCYDNKLTNLEGSPSSVRGDFWCYDNQLTSLEDGPSSVGGLFWCHNNQLTSLIGSPSSVGGDFWCQENNLTSLEGSPSSVGGRFWCYKNQLTGLEGSPKSVGQFICDEPFKTLIRLFNSYEDFKLSVEKEDWLEGNKINWVKFKDVIEEGEYTKRRSTVTGFLYPDSDLLSLVEYIEGFEFTHKPKK